MPRSVTTKGHTTSSKSGRGASLLLAAVLTCCCVLRGDDAPANAAPDNAAPAAPYSNDFEKAQVGKLPEDLLVLNGTFAVKEEPGNKFLELEGKPIDTLGLLFGPKGQALLDVRGRVQSTSRGKLFPEFGLGANDAGGYKVWLLPGQNAVELRRGETTLLRKPYKWESGTWTHFRLRVSAAGEGKWKAQAKAWPASGKEPQEWALSAEVTEAPPPGQASVWGHPYSDTPIRFDDLSATPLGDGKPQ